MNINFGKGLKRIYIVASIFWGVFMIFATIEELDRTDQTYTRQIGTTKSCDEIRNPGPAEQTGEGLQLNISNRLIIFN